MLPTHDYPIAVTFTGLTSVTAGTTLGKAYFINRTTKDIEYVDVVAKSSTTAAAMVSLNNKREGTFPNGFENGQVIEAGITGEHFGNASHTIDTTKGGGKLTIGVTATTSTTHPGVTL